MMSLGYHFNTEVGAVIRAERVAEHLEEKENKDVYVNMVRPYSVNALYPLVREIKINIHITYLKFLRIVHSRDGLHQVGSRMVAEVGADVANTQTSTAGLQILRMLKSRFVQCIDLWS